jgi:hypothetical protein
VKILRVGDPHAKVNNLAEMKRLMDFVLETAEKNQVNRVEILGDLFHTHAVLRLEVQEFWTRQLMQFARKVETVVLAGNHDMSGDHKATFTALTLFAAMAWDLPTLKIVNKPKRFGVYGYVPYMHSHSDFINVTTALADEGAKVLVCHQTLQGSRYESGFYAEDGVPTGEWSARFTHIISGHIHTEQSFENIIYPGTARWDGVVDANLRKGIWIFEHDDSGKILSSDFISTQDVCSPLKSITWTEGDPAPAEWGPNERVTLELIGSSEWIRQQKIAYKGKAGIQSKITDAEKMEQRKRKTGTNLEDFLRNIYPATMDREALLKCAKEFGLV